MKTKHKRKIDRIRTKARRNISVLLERQNHKCKYCDKLIFSPKYLREIEKSYKIILNIASLIIYEIEGLNIIFNKATVDHIKDINEGGNNYINNLVAACYDCNKNKNKKKQFKNRRKNEY